MKIRIILAVSGLIITPVIGLLAQTSETQVTSTSIYSCNNNGVCDTNTGETTTNCEKDCGQATTLRDTCGDKICQSTESKSSCSADCGYPWVCGDGICGGTETDWNCPQDCPKPEVPAIYCGDKICQSDESQSSCPVDCGYPLICGDGVCNGTDTYDNCPKDCLKPTATPTAATTATQMPATQTTTVPAPTPATSETSIPKPIATPTAATTATQMPATQTTTVPAPTPATSETSIPKPTIIGTPRSTTVGAIPPATKCGVSAFKTCNECGLGVYKNVFVKCSDGAEITLGSASSCKPADLWNQYAKEACVNHCSSGGWGGWSDFVSGPIVCAEGNTGEVTGSTPVPPATKPAEVPKATSVCYISDYLFQKYNLLIIELQKSELDRTRAELITKEIISLKQQIAAQQKECVSASPQPISTAVSRPTITALPTTTENTPVAVSIDHCNEVAQWETKIAYYKKLNGLNDADLKKDGFSREEIEKILQELSLGIEKVRGKCGGQEKTPIKSRITAITGAVSITEAVRPVVAESGQEISAYYKARIEKAVSAKGEEKQVEELKTLRDEIDGLISNLIKSRKELEVSELNSLVKEVKVSRGEIKADNISVKTTEKKMIASIGDRPVSVEPTENQVIIRDKGLEVSTNEVTIKENVLSVGGVDVEMSASEVTEKLGLTPTTIELKEENSKAVYTMQIDERRKLFGFIPFNTQKIVVADAENGNTLSEERPWYSFLTTK